jgi:hypothetical protein
VIDGMGPIDQVSDAPVAETSQPGDAEQPDSANDALQDASYPSYDAARADAQDAPVAAQFGECISAWPRPSGVTAASLTIEPRIRWVTSAGTSVDPISPVISTTASGVAVTFWSSLIIIDGNGVVSAIFRSAAPDVLSGAASDPSGNLYLADSRFVYGLDPTGKETWRTPVGTSASKFEFVAPSALVLSDTGLLFVAAVDGNLWAIDHKNGSVVASYPVGLTEASTPRRIELGVADVLFLERALNLSGGLTQGVGILSATTGSWRGELVDSDGWLPPYVLVGGYDIGLVGWGYTDINSASTRTTVFDRCGTGLDPIRWTG